MLLVGLVCRHRFVIPIVAVTLMISAGPASAQDLVAAGGVATGTDAQKFCANIADAAADARFAWEAKTLQSLKAEVEAATAALDAKRVELQEWVTRREELQKLAEQAVIDIYSKMRPEAAAAQISALDERTAAAVLTRLNARTASTILGEMDIPRAVSLAELISGNDEPSIAGAASP